MNKPISLDQIVRAMRVHRMASVTTGNPMAGALAKTLGVETRGLFYALNREVKNANPRLRKIEWTTFSTNRPVCATYELVQLEDKQFIRK